MKIYQHYVLFLMTLDESYFTLILREIKPLIYRLIQDIDPNEKEDSLQNVVLEFYLKMEKHVFTVTGLSSFFKAVKMWLPLADSSDDFKCQVKCRDEINRFLGVTTFLDDAWNAYQYNSFDFNDFCYRFTNEYGNACMINYLKKICKTELSHANKRKSEREKLIAYSLNEHDQFGNELIDQVSDTPKEEDNEPLSLACLTQDDIDFLSYRYNKYGKKNSQSQMAKKQYVTQQSISKRIKKIQDAVLESNFLAKKKK